MKRILIVENGLTIGGQAKSLLNLLSCIHNKYQIDLLLVNEDGDYSDTLPNNVRLIPSNIFLKSLIVSLEKAKKSPVLFILKVFNATISKFFKNKIAISIALMTIKNLGYYDVAISFSNDGDERHCLGISNDLVLRKSKAKTKITFFHNDPIDSGLMTKNNLKKLYKFDKIAFVSKSCRDRFVGKFGDPQGKCEVVYNTNNIDEIMSLSEEANGEFDEKYFNIVLVGRLSKEKGHNRLMSVVSRLNKADIRLHFIGDSSTRQEYYDLAKDLNMQDQVVFWGFQQNPYKFMAQADLLVVASYHEAAPMVINEAKILGLPILTTETSSAKEMVPESDGVVCENSEDGLYNALKDIYDNKLHTKLKETIKETKYSNDEAIRMFEELVG